MTPRAAVVRPISPEEHLAHLQSLPSASFLQTPAWGRVKAEWRRESIGFFDGSELVGSGLVLYRQIPKLKRYLAYLPEGPTLDWSRDDLTDLLAAMTKHLADRGAFAVRMGPPVVLRRWSARTVKAAIADPVLRRLGDAPADATSDQGRRLVSLLKQAGWREQAPEDGFGVGQPRFNFWLPIAGRTEDEVLRGMNQLWRRNIKKADKAGLEVTTGKRDDLPAFHTIYAETAQRDHFTPRPLSYFQTMYDALTEEDPERFRLYLAHHEGDLVAATTMVRVGGHAWYSYGASTTAKREVRGSNAVQWQMIRDAMAAGASVYDLRGITDTLDADDPHVGLVQFKVGTGGDAVEYAGEWDLPLSRVLYHAFDLYMRRR
ncbi:MAG TPA: peptidoglycan bridge formation glycyltransferase FemA/FemB family protein [Nocardioidaceae bacterium]|nr:peptidoglycan bridge formation glycyltransferase FemA/FemB family protein [Nocardioidaceae bacterium]